MNAQRHDSAKAFGTSAIPHRTYLSLNMPIMGYHSSKKQKVKTLLLITGYLSRVYVCSSQTERIDLPTPIYRSCTADLDCIRLRLFILVELNLYKSDSVPKIFVYILCTSRGEHLELSSVEVGWFSVEIHEITFNVEMSPLPP